jgi:hypothetical protein
LRSIIDLEIPGREQTMKKYKVSKWVIVGLITLTMFMGTGCAMFTDLLGIDGVDTPPEIDGVNTPPEISSLAPSATSVALEGSCTVSCTASDADGDTLTYDWAATGGAITGEGSTITWMAPAAEGSYSITVSVSDGKGGTASDSCTISVANAPPEISSLDPSATSVAIEGSCTVSCTASDADGDTLTYDWAATGGAITGEGSTITWMAPAAEGSYTITVTVSDGKGGTASDSCTVVAEMRFGSIDIQSSPDGATVYLDGFDTGNITPYIITNLEPGDYTIKLDLFHYEYREETVAVNADETTYINWSLIHASEQMVAVQPASAAGKDSTVSISAPSTNYGDQDDLLAGTRAMGIYRAYLQFDFDSIPDDAVILDARLGLYYYNSITSTTAEIGAYLVEGSWNEGTITWDNQPAVSTTTEDDLSLSGSAVNVFVYWYVGDAVKGWWDGSIPNYGVMLREIDEVGWYAWKYFWSSDSGSASVRPKLEVLYYDPNP